MGHGKHPPPTVRAVLDGEIPIEYLFRGHVEQLLDPGRESFPAGQGRQSPPAVENRFDGQLLHDARPAKHEAADSTSPELVHHSTEEDFPAGHFMQSDPPSE